MHMQFHDRSEAGQYLAKKLTKYAYQPDVVVLALPRGGVPVAFELASRLGTPLDVFPVRKLGVPGHEELAMGAIASGVRVLNENVVDSLQIPEELIAEVAAREQKILERRERAYRGGRPAVEVEGRTVILVDDGIATGSTVRAAVAAIQRRGASRIIVAAPVASLAAARQLQAEGNELVACMTPADFYAVGEWFENFPQVSDEQVRDLLERSCAVPVKAD